MSPDDLAAVVCAAVAPFVARIAALEDRIGHLDAEARTDTATIATLRERVAVLETRAPVPGPSGADGAAGRDGRDGLGFDDIAVEHDGERAFTFTLTRHDLVEGVVSKALGTFTIPAMIYRDTYAPSRAYVRGDVITDHGSLWHCQKDTTARPETPSGAAAWRLCVKRGEKGRDAAALVGVR